MTPPLLFDDVVALLRAHVDEYQWLLDRMADRRCTVTVRGRHTLIFVVHNICHERVRAFSLKQWGQLNALVANRCGRHAEVEFKSSAPPTIAYQRMFWIDAENEWRSTTMRDAFWAMSIDAESDSDTRGCMAEAALGEAL